MRSFQDIYDIAAERKGGAEALEELLDPIPQIARDLTKAPDDRWLSAMTRAIFQAGFSWKVIDAKWPGFEEAFKGFDIDACAMMSDDWFDDLVRDSRIVRNHIKIRTVRENAVFCTEMRDEAGSVAAFFTGWPKADFAGLLETLKTRGSRLGGTTGQYFLRFSGIDGYILSKDVVARLIAEGVIDKAPGSKSSMRAVQAAFNIWAEQSGRPVREISRVLALSL